MEWKYTDEKETVVYRILPNGDRESCLVSTIQKWIDSGNTPLPAFTQAELDERAARAAKAKAMAQTVRDNLPTMSQVQTAIDNISNLADAKAFLKKLAAVVYIHVKADNV